MPTQKQAKVYTAASQFWVGNSFYKPIDMGGKAVGEDDPILTSHAARFKVYDPLGGTERSTRIARLEAPYEEPVPVVAHTHPHE